MGEELWPKFLSCIEESIGAAKFSTWFEPLKYLGREGTCLRIQVSNDFRYKWLRENYLPLMTQVARQLIGAEATIGFEIGGKETGAAESVGPSSDTAQPSTAQSLPSPPAVEESPFNQRLTFENFVVGPGNQLAHAACLAVAQDPAEAYNPLFLYGGVGLGKTHLLHSIGHHIHKTRPNLRIAYVSSENFLNDLVTAIQSHDVVEFRNTYRTYNILMIDDIQFIAGKERTQEEFFHTFNDLYNSQRQIILTSDRSPREMATLEDRLRSRFEWGMIADLQPPDLETRVAILKKKAELCEVDLPDAVSYLIANHIRADVRKLEGALNRLVLQCSTILRQRTITEEMAQTVLHDMLDRGEAAITVDRIQEAVSAHFKVPLQLLMSNKRSKEVAMARQVAMYLSRELTKSSLPDIGKQFHKDHTTVIHGCEKIRRLIDSDELFKSEIDQLVSRLQG